MSDITQTQTGSTPNGTHGSDKFGQMATQVQAIALTGKGPIPVGFAIDENIHGSIPMYSGKNTTVVELTKAQAQAAINAINVLALESSLNTSTRNDVELSEDITVALTQTYQLSKGKNAGMHVSMIGHMVKTEMGKLKSEYEKAEAAKALAAATTTFTGPEGKQFVNYGKAQKAWARYIHKTEFPTIAGNWFDNPQHKARLLGMGAERIVIVNKGEEAPAPASAVVAAPEAQTIQTTLVDVGALAPDVTPQADVQADPTLVAAYMAQGQTAAQALESATAVARLQQNL